MRIRYIADVDGHVSGSEVQSFEIDEYEVNLNFDSSGLESIEVSKSLTEDEREQLVNQMKEKSSGHHEIILSGYDSIHSGMMNVFQKMESYFGLSGVRDIQWEDARTEFVPETEEEEEELDVYEFSFSREYPKTPHVWEESLIREADWDHIEELKLPLLFHRKAKNFYDDFDYIHSFINSYFIIEGFYANGKHQNVEEEYLGSEELVDAVETRLPQHLDEHQEELAPFFDFYDKEMDAEGFIELFTIIRHQLHHYFHEDTRPHLPDYFNSEEYRPLSLALMDITFYLLLLKTHQVNQEDQ